MQARIRPHLCTNGNTHITMNLFPILFVLFFLIPLIEIYILIQVGSVIGAPLTIVSVVFTAVLGAYLIRRQGFKTFARFQGKLQSGELPAQEMVDGFCLLIAGAFLMTPGFFTDAMGFALLIPPVRTLLYSRISRSASVHVVSGHGANRPGGPDSSRQKPLEGEYRHIDDD